MRCILLREFLVQVDHHQTDHQPEHRVAGGRVQQFPTGRQVIRQFAQNRQACNTQRIIPQAGRVLYPFHQQKGEDGHSTGLHGLQEQRQRCIQHRCAGGLHLLQQLPETDSAQVQQTVLQDAFAQHPGQKKEHPPCPQPIAADAGRSFPGSFHRGVLLSGCIGRGSPGISP